MQREFENITSLTMRIDHLIQRGSEISDAHLQDLIGASSSQLDVKAWIDRNNLGKCIKSAHGYYGALQDFHAIHCRSPSIKGMVYIDNSASNDQARPRGFQGDFMGDLSFWSSQYPTIGIPVLAKETTLFQHSDSDKVVRFELPCLTYQNTYEVPNYMSMKTFFSHTGCIVNFCSACECMMSIL